MKIRNIAMDEADCPSCPSSLTVEMTIDEAKFITLLAGTCSGDTSEKVMEGGAEIVAEIYDCLEYSFFSKFFVNGAEGA